MAHLPAHLAPPYRLIRAQKLLTEAVAAIASYKGPADDVDLHQAIYAIDRAKMILAKRIDADMPGGIIGYAERTLAKADEVLRKHGR